MLEDLYSKRVVNRIRASKYSYWLEQFAINLKSTGYKLNVIHTYVCSAEHFTNWINSQNITSITKDTFNKFLFDHLPNCHCPKPSAKRLISVSVGINHFYKFLIQIDEVKIVPKLATYIDKEIDNYEKFLKEICGLADNTITYRIKIVRAFLVQCFGNNRIDYQKLDYTLIIKFTTQKVTSLSPGSISRISTTLRSYFRFLVINKKINKNLIKVIPTVPNWKLSSIPKYIKNEEIKKFLNSFNKKDSTGQRDYAIALCFTELGLRTKEVVNLRLENIDWQKGTLTISHTKTHKERILPVSYSLGNAIANYLKYYRPKSEYRFLFLRHTIPVGAPVTSELLRGIIRRAFDRAKIIPPTAGPQVLRHTLATKMINNGVQIKAIADILGHESITTTAIYTKVDFSSLKNAVLPWPVRKGKEQ